MVKLDEAKILWIIRCKGEGKKNADVAGVQKISVRRIQQIYSLYRKNRKAPILRKPGRPDRPITVQEREIVRYTHKQFRANAAYLERYIKKTHGIKINHNRIHRIMLDEGLSEETQKVTGLSLRQKHARLWKITKFV